MSHYLFVEGNTTGTGRLAVERLLASGQRVTFLTRERRKYPFLGTPHPGLTVVEGETNEVEEVQRRVEEIAAGGAVDALLTFSEFYIAIVAEVAARLGFRFLSPEAARHCRNKEATRRALRAAGLPTPRFLLVASADEALEAAEEIAFPCVVKPPADSSSFGVRRVADREELVDQVRRLATLAENVRGQRLDGRVLIEELLDGPEYSVETVTLPDSGCHVVGVVTKHLSAPPWFVELGHDFPSAAPPRRRQALEQAALAALAAVGFDFGPAHTEIRWTCRGPVVVEINGRLAGGLIPELVSHAAGIDLLGGWLDLLIGRPIDLRPQHRRGAAIRFLTAAEVGRVVAVEGVQQARAQAGVVEVEVKVARGEAVAPAVDTYGRLGHVLAVGDDAEQAARAAAAGLAELRLTIVPEEVPATESLPAATPGSSRPATEPRSSAGG